MARSQGGDAPPPMPPPLPYEVVFRDGSKECINNVSHVESSGEVIVFVNQDRRMIAFYPVAMIASVKSEKADVPETPQIERPQLSLVGNFGRH